MRWRPIRRSVRGRLSVPVIDISVCALLKHLGAGRQILWAMRLEYHAGIDSHISVAFIQLR